MDYNDRDIRMADQNANEVHRTYCNNRHGAGMLPMLKPDDTVLIQIDDDKKWRGYGQVLGPDNSNGRSHTSLILPNVSPGAARSVSSSF